MIIFQVNIRLTVPNKDNLFTGGCVECRSEFRVPDQILVLDKGEEKKYEKFK